MKKILLAGAAFTALAVGPALAADLGRPVYKAPLPPAPVYNWTGLYVGVNGGIGGDQFKYPFDASAGGFAVSGEASTHSFGGFGGGQIGYNWQFSPSWVAGLEADIQGGDIDGTASISVSTPVGGLSASGGSKLDWFGTVRGRIGYLVTPAALLYATGGWAYGHVKTSLDFSTPGISSSFSEDHDKSGWTVGAGLEYAFNPSWSFKAEYLYMDLGEDNVFNGTPTLLPGVSLSVDEKTTVHTFKAGVNYKFGAL